MTDILVAGALHWDTLVHVSHFPRPGETQQGQRVEYAFGGKGGSQAIAASRLGARVTMAGAIGTDEAGRQIMHALAAAGVTVRALQQIEGASGTTVSIHLKGERPAAVTVPGVNSLLMAGKIAVPGGVKVILLQSEIEPDVGLSLIARATDAEVILNASPANPLPKELLKRTDTLIVNPQEAASLLGKSDTPDQMARALLVKGPSKVIVTLGRDGCVLALPKGGTTTFPAHRVTQVSRVGVGDAFCGAFAAARAAGATIDMAIRRAQAYAALFVATEPHERMAISAGHVDQLIT